MLHHVSANKASYHSRAAPSAAYLSRDKQLQGTYQHQVDTREICPLCSDPWKGCCRCPEKVIEELRAIQDTHLEPAQLGSAHELQRRLEHQPDGDILALLPQPLHLTHAQKSFSPAFEKIESFCSRCPMVTAGLGDRTTFAEPREYSEDRQHA